MAEWWESAPVVTQQPAASIPSAGADDWYKSAPVVGAPESTTSDVGKSLASGATKGAIGLLGLPGDISRLADYGPSWLLAHGAEKLGLLPNGKTADDLIKDSSALDLPRDPISLPTSSDFINLAKTDLGVPFHEPSTRFGKYADTVGSFIPGAIAAPGSMMANALKFGVLPGISSEAAGQATEGKPAEPWVRGAAALATGGGAALLSRPNTAERMVASAGAGVTPQQYQAAQTLVEDAAKRGITLTPAEAVQHVTGGATRLGDIQRITESTTEGGQRMAAALADRPAQMQAATEDALNSVAPRSTQPSYLGPQMQEAGQGALDRVRQSINKMSEPYYNAAENVRIPPNEYAQMASLPGFEEAYNAVRNNPQLNRNVAHLPEDSVGVLNEVKKQLDNMAQSATSHANPTANAQIGAGYSSDANAAQRMGRQLSPDYASALDIQAQGRSQVLDPLAAGPVGQITSTTDHVAQGRALLGDRPSPQEVSRATSSLMAQDPQATRGLVREHLGRTADATVAGLDSAGRPDQFGGAKFARDVNGGREGDNIAAALNTIDPKAAQNVNGLVEALAATGQRQRPGSLTAFNQESLRDMKSGGAQAYVSALINPMHKVTDVVQRTRLGSQSNTLADLLLSGPSGVRRIQDLAASGTGNTRALAQALLSSKPLSNGQRQ